MSIQLALKDYIEELFGFGLFIREVPRDISLPSYMLERYALYEAELFEKRFTLMVSYDSEEIQLRSLKKHIALLQERMAVSTEIIFVCPSMSNYGRRKFIEEGIPFIVPGMQLYVPSLGVAFSKHASKRHYKLLNNWYDKNMEQSMPSSLTPSAQAVLFDLMTNGTVNRTQNEIANSIGISKMAVSRGFSLLEDLKIIKTRMVGVKNYHSFVHEGRQLWNRIEDYLIDPVERSVFIGKESFKKLKHVELVISGESALEKISMLASPKIESYALYKKDWIKIDIEDECLPAIADDIVRIEIWSHPVPVTRSGIHQIALYLAMRSNWDERIQSILDALINDYSWDSIESTDIGINVWTESGQRNE